MSAWTGFLHFIDGLGNAVTTFFRDPIDGIEDLFNPSNYDGRSSLNRPTISQLNRARARAEANITKYTNDYDNYDNKLQDYLSNIDNDKEELEQGYDNVYDSPTAAAAYEGLRNYSSKLKSMKQQLNKLSKKLNNATYYSTYFNGKYNQAMNAKNRTSSELSQGIGEVAGMLPMLFM